LTQHVKQEEKDLSATLIQWKETYFDGLGRTVSQKRGGPNVTDVITDTQYNSQGLVWKQSNPYFSGATIYNAVNSYDPVGRLIKTVNPDATETSIGYIQGTNTYIDANYHKKEELKDMYGRTIVINEFTGTGTTPSPYAPYATTAYWYDVLNNLETVIDAKGNQTDIIYDTLSRKTSMDDPDMGHWEYQYDLNGNLKYQKDAKLQEVYFQYDELNRLRQKDYGIQKALGSGDIVYTYDEGSSSINPVGRLTTLTDNYSGIIDTYAYDPMGQIKETGKTINSQTYTTRTGYDPLGRVETITYPDNSVVKYINDALDNLIQVKDPSGAPVYAAYGNYNAKGQYGTITYANGVSTTYNYNPYNNRLTSIETSSPTAGNLMNLAYDQYDNGGNITHITDSINYPGGISRTRSYVYDDLDRLIEADSPAYSGKLLYQYDKIGNMTYNCKYGYYYYDDPNHVHAVTTIKKTDGTLVNSYSYDPNGNMYAGAGRGLTYDYDNRPTHITANGVIVDSVYDANGQRVKKSASGSTTIYIGQTYECTGTQCTKYIISGTQIIAQISAAGTYYYHSDHLGSSSIITNASGSKAEDIFYYPYGETQTNSGSVNVKYKYTGKEFDGEDGLYYYGARYYDPKLARFISADTIVPLPFYPISLNRYAYAYNNPIILKDLDGHLTFCWEGCSDDSSGDYDDSGDYSTSNYGSTAQTTVTATYQFIFVIMNPTIITPSACGVKSFTVTIFPLSG
jgi:RHS repeat-associated protein